MEHQFRIIITLLLVFTFTGCENVDVTGMFNSSESVNQRFEQSMNWNALHPYKEITVTSDNYFILSMGDSHVGGTKNLNSFLSIAKTTNASAVVMVGDLTTGHSNDYAVFQNNLLYHDSLNTFLMVGNHDLFFDGWNEYYSRFGSSVYLFTIKTPTAEDLFICLDTGNGTLGNKQLDWLNEILQTSRNNHRFCTVFTHNNFFRNRHTLSTNPLVEELLVLMDLFTKYRVDMVITAHDHIKYAEKFGNTNYIIMDALMDGLDYAGYLRLSVENGNIEYRFMNFGI
jgi:predicted phosphodiesterase